jgi:hypothetical protein
MNILAIDPGPEKSAWVYLVDGIPVQSAWEDNGRVNVMIAGECMTASGPEHLVIEKVMNYGMPSGESVFETVFWTGRFIQSWGSPTAIMLKLLGQKRHTSSRIPRLDVKVALCHDAKAKKGNVNQAIKDHYDTISPVGTKKNQGPLYEFARKHGPGLTHRWDALAVGLTYLKENE